MEGGALDLYRFDDEHLSVREHCAGARGLPSSVLEFCPHLYPQDVLMRFTGKEEIINFLMIRARTKGKTLGGRLILPTFEFLIKKPQCRPQQHWLNPYVLCHIFF